jgi:hypothetical protein
MRQFNKYRLWISCFVGLLSSVATAQVVHVGSRPAQVIARGPAPRFTILGAITTTATPGSVSFNLVSKGTATASVPIAINTTWSGISLFAAGVSGYAYFMNPSSALSGGSPAVSIPSSCVYGKDSTGTFTSYTPFTQAGPFGSGNSFQLFTGGTGTLLGILGFGGSHADNLTLQINLSTLPQLPAGTYTGILMIQSEAF